MGLNLTETDRAELARILMSLFDDWQLTAAERIQLLKLPADTRPRVLERYRQGTPLPADEELLNRAEHFLSIYHLLEMIFPHNPHLAQLWITTPNRYFNEYTPLQVMLAEGMIGIQRARQHLDCGERG